MKADTLFAALPDLSARIMRDVLVSELDLNWDMFCRHSRLKPVCFDDGETELLAREELMLQRGFADSTANHPDLWYQAGLRYRSIKYGALGLAMMTAGNLGEALRVACRYQALTYSLIAYRFAVMPNGACALIGEDQDLPDHLRNFTQHRDLGAIRTLVADLMAGEPVLERVTVAAPPPAGWDALQKQFPCDVQFDAPQTQWRFLPGSAWRALPLADRDLSVIYSARCDGMLSRAAADTPLSQRLTNIMNLGGHCLPSAGEAAERLAMSERTLHRRLAEEGTRFSALLDSARYARAQTLLADRHMTIEAIAFALGFAEASSFSRAFKRWTGMGALEYRRSQQNGSGQTQR